MSMSCTGAQRPNSWRVTSARTLAGAGCDGVVAFHAGSLIDAYWNLRAGAEAKTATWSKGESSMVLA
jgi:hypothetical protein